MNYFQKWLTLFNIEGLINAGEDKKMLKIHEEYVVDVDGNKKAVVVSMLEWQKILDALEELDDIKAYDEAKSKPSNPIPFEKAINDIQKG